MTQYNSLNLKLSDSQLTNLTSNYNDNTNFSHKLLLTSGQVTNLRKAFVNTLSANKKLSKLKYLK